MQWYTATMTEADGTVSEWNYCAYGPLDFGLIESEPIDAPEGFGESVRGVSLADKDREMEDR